jgi:serine protease Do
MDTRPIFRIKRQLSEKIMFPISRYRGIFCATIVLITGLLGTANWNNSPLFAQSGSVSAQRLSQIFAGDVPRDVAELKAMEVRQKALMTKVLPATVAVQVGMGHGSGVIVSADGYVLTASHVAGRPGHNAILTLSNGQRVRGKTLGMNRSIDAGLIKISDSPPIGEDGEWTHVEMHSTGELNSGQWCFAIGHPGGYQSDRGAVLRGGRVLRQIPSTIVTDCVLISGDSGGPLFDIDGNVVGIHSRIADETTLNMHVPIRGYRESWDRLVKGEAWGHLPGHEPYIGVIGDPSEDLAKVTEVVSGSPAEGANIRVGDIIVEFGGQEVSDFASLRSLVLAHNPGNRVRLKVKRGDETIDLRITIGRRG